MGDLEPITKDQIAVWSSNSVEELTMWCAMYNHWPSSKGQRSCNISASETLLLGNGRSY